ncbi:MAG: DUF4179 domain-containing protein [Anaerolineae bacterium]|nr:DUF4179 domain-containing protein [Anaerolineae bacterium]
MKADQFRQALHELAERAVPASPDLWPRVQKRVAGRPIRAGWAGSPPVARLGWVALTAAVLLVFGTAAYSAAPTILRLLQQDMRTQAADVARLAKPLHLSQAAGGVTVTLEWAYADAERVLVAYTVHSADGRQFDLRDYSLTETTGPVLAWQGTYGDGEGQWVAVFDSLPGGVALPAALNLRFTARAQEVVLPSQSSAGPATEGGSNAVQLEPVPAGQIVGPFAFEFSVPLVSPDRSG